MKIHLSESIAMTTGGSFYKLLSTVTSSGNHFCITSKRHTAHVREGIWVGLTH